MHRQIWKYFAIIVILALGPSLSDLARNVRAERVLVSKSSLNSSIQSQATILPIWWEHILREFLFKTISPLPAANIGLYKRILDAPFYGGPFPETSSNDNNTIILSRGDVFYLPSGQWILCQEGCSKCDVCIEQKSSAVKWTLRRIKKTSFFGPSRYYLQLTITPQSDTSFYVKSPWPRPYIYMIPQQFDNFQYNPAPQSFNGTSASLREAQNPMEGDNGTKQLSTDSSASSTEKLENARLPTTTPKNIRKLRHRPKATTKRSVIGTSPVDHGNITKDLCSESKSLKPKLILGHDQDGQKHLIHVIPALQQRETLLKRNLPMGDTYLYNQTIDQNESLDRAAQNRSVQLAYQKLYRRILNSLNSQRHNIERFLLSAESRNSEHPVLMTRERENKTEIQLEAQTEKDSRVNENKQDIRFESYNAAYNNSIINKLDSLGGKNLGNPALFGHIRNIVSRDRGTQQMYLANNSELLFNSSNEW